MKGTWDSIHVVEVVDKGKNAHYKLTSTVMLFIETETKETGRVTLAGSLTRQVRQATFYLAIVARVVRPRRAQFSTSLLTCGVMITQQDEKDFPVDKVNPHVANIGRMIEDMELKLRTTLQTIYFGKTKDIVNELRQVVPVSVLKSRSALQQQIAGAIGGRGN
jgi:capping protein beta